MKKYMGILLLAFFTLSCTEQIERNVGGPCEDCQAALDYLKSSRKLKSVDTLPNFLENEPKIKITETVFQSDRKTPAENILLFVYHLDRKGVYQSARIKTVMNYNLLYFYHSKI